MENLLEIRGLCKEYSDFVLKDIDLTVRPGRIVGLIGENGAGKTTTLKAALNIIKPSAGQIRLMGGEPSDQQVRAEVAAVFEDSFFYEGFHLLLVVDSGCFLNGQAHNGEIENCHTGSNKCAQKYGVVKSQETFQT